MRVLFTGGTVVTGRGTRKADVVTDGEKILTVQARYRGPFNKAVNAHGCLLFPGFIDARTHFDLDADGVTTADNFYTGSQAALRGGSTTILDAVRPGGHESLRAALDRWRAKADGQTFCDYGFHMTLTAWDGEAERLFSDGVSSFVLSADAPGNRGLYEALRTLSPRGGVCAVSCGNGGVTAALRDELRTAGTLSAADFPRAYPVALEAEAVNRVLRVAQTADAPVVILNASCAETLTEIARARQRGQTVYVETCPHYLILDESRYADADAPLYVCTPPLRAPSDRDALLDALRRHEIQYVSSAHRAYTPVQKRTGRDASGLPGAEERGVLLYSYGKLNAADLCRVLCETPAKLYGLWPRKGRIAPGADADLVLYDPGDSHLILAENGASAAGYTPYERFPAVGGVRQVWLRGKLCVDRGRVLSVTPAGSYLPRGRVKEPLL